MRELDKKQTIILVLGAVILTGFAVFRYIPIVRKKLEMRKQISKHSLSMEQIQSYAGSLPELRLEKEQLQEQLEIYDVKIPEGKQFARLWQQIADAMNDCQLSEQSVQPGAEKVSEQLCCIPLSIECEGTLEQVFQFFQSLENFDRLVRVEEVQLENSAEFDATVRLNATANVYYQPDNPDNG